MIILLMLLYSVLASGTLPNFFGFSGEETATVAPVNNATAKVHHNRHHRVKKVKRYRDIPRQTNYMTINIDGCPDVGYFFRREMAPNSLQMCYLCFCRSDGTAVCWPRDNKRCDKEHFHFHGAGKKRELPRSRRSPMSFGDLFFRDATRDALNKQSPEECKPHENSYSEGCPPADWCVGCTICDCDANGRWDCHLLSFCSEEDKKRKKKNRGKTYVQKSVDGTSEDQRYKDKKQPENAQEEVQKLARLISQIGEKQARKYNGLNPRHRRTEEIKKNLTIAMMEPKRIPKAIRKQKANKLSQLQKQDQKVRKSSLKTNDNGLVVVRQKDDEKKEKYKEKLKENNDKAKILAKVNAAPKPLHPFNIKKKTQIKRNAQTSKPATKVVKPVRRAMVKKSSNKRPGNKNAINKRNIKTKKIENSRKQGQIKKPVVKAKFMTKPKQTTSSQRQLKTTATTKTTTTTTTTTEDSSSSINVKPRTNKKPRKRQAPKQAQIDSKRLISDIQKKFHMRFMKEVDKLIEDEKVNTKKIKRSAPLVKKIGVRKMVENRNRTKYQGVSKPVKRSSKVALDRSNKIKIYRSKREAPKENYFATLNSKWEVEYDTTINPTRVLDKTTRNVTLSTEPIVHKLNHAVDNTISAISEEYDIQYSGKLNAAKRSVDDQMDDLSVVRLDKEKINETFSVQSILNDTNGMNFTDQNTLVPTYAPIENKGNIIVINPNVASNHEIYDIFEDKVTNLNKKTTIKTKVEINNTTKYITSDDINKRDDTTTEITILDYAPTGVLSTEVISIFKNITNLINVITIKKNENSTSNFTKHFENAGKSITELHDQVMDAYYPLNLTTASDSLPSVLFYDNNTSKTTEWIDKSVVVINESYNAKKDMDFMPTSTTQAMEIIDEHFIFTKGVDIVNATNTINIKKNTENVFQTEDFSKMHSVDNSTLYGSSTTNAVNSPITTVTSDMYTNQKPSVTTDVAVIVKTIETNYAEHPMTDYFTSTKIGKTENIYTPEMFRHEIFTERSSESAKASVRFNVLNAKSRKNTTVGNDYDFNMSHFNTVPKSYENTKKNFTIKSDKTETTIKQSYDITFNDSILVKPVSIQYLGNGVDKNVLFLNNTSTYHEKERMEKSNKTLNESDRNVLLVLGKDSNYSTNSPLEEKSLHIKGSTINPNWMDEKTTNTEVILLLNDNVTTTDEYKVEPNLNAELYKNKISSYDVPTLTSRRKKHKLRKLVTTLYDKTNKDERYYINNQNHESKNTLDNNDFKHFFTKTLRGINSSKDNKGLSRSKIVKYLQKFFKNIFSSNKSSNRTVQSQIDKKNVINILCAAFGPCNINLNNKAKLLSKIDHLNSETYQMLRSIKIIKGLLKLVDIPSNDKKIGHRKLNSSNFKSDVQKLHELLKNTYVNKEHLNKITDTQKTQIEYIKKTTHTFIQSAAKFIMVLNEIINIITLPDYKNKEDQLKFKSDKIDDKRNIKKESLVKNNLTEVEQPLTKLKDLISKYTIIQNTFMKKIYNVISNLDTKHVKYNKTTERVPEFIPNKTETIKANTISIMQNLKKLRNLAENVEINTRKKRDLADDDSIEYLLMLMEYLLKQSHPLDVAPVNDGIDLLIEAIKSAPDIKSIKKKVLYQGINYNFTATTTESSEVNISREDSNSVDNKISKEENNTSNIEDTRFNIIDNTDDGEDEEDDRFYYKRRGLSEPNLKQGDLLKPTEVTTSAYAVPSNTSPNAVELSHQNVLSDTVYANPNTESIEVKSYDKSNETEDAKYEPFNVDIEDEIVNLNSSEIIDTTVAPEVNTHVYKRKMDNFKKNEDNISASVGKSKLDWLDESYEEEIRSEVNSSASTRSPVKKNLAVTKQQRKINDASVLSKEEDKMKRGSDEEVLRKKNLELLNSLDYVTQKSDVDASESKESNSEDKYSGDDGFSSDFR